ncbi:hypothetical protein Gotur_030980 [Gossypium turneri]
MAKVKSSTALFFSLNLFFFALVSSYNVDNNPNGSSYSTKSRNPVVIRPGYKFPNDLKAITDEPLNSSSQRFLRFPKKGSCGLEPTLSLLKEYSLFLCITRLTLPSMSFQMIFSFCAKADALYVLGKLHSRKPLLLGHDCARYLKEQEVVQIQSLRI